MEVIRAEGLVRSFGDRLAVDRVDFSVAQGETFGLLGPNGAGKTTTISMVCGLLAPDAGAVTVAGEPMSIQRCAAKSHIGLVPQGIALYQDLTGRENLEFFGRLQGLDRASLKRRIEEVLDLVGLADRADDRVQDWSGGMQRRCNIGAALLHEPELLVLDEPTVGVDPQSRNAILTGIAGLQEAGMAVIYTTHYMEEAERLCDRVAVMDEGRIVAEGTPGELVALVGEHPVIRLSGQGDFAGLAAGLEGTEGVVSATVSDGRVDVVADGSGVILERMLRTATELGVQVAEVSIDQPDLEDVFLHLTGKALRD